MIAVLIILALVPFLGGCSWFSTDDGHTNDTIHQSACTEIATQTHDIIASEIHESTLDVEPLPILVESLPESANKAMQTIPSIVDASSEREFTTTHKPTKKRRRRRRTIRKQEVDQSSTPTPKTIADFALTPDTTTQEILNPESVITALQPKQKSIQEKNVIRTVAVQSIIDKPMLTVKHWTGKYVPTLLDITINNTVLHLIHNKKVVPLPETPIVTHDDMLTVTVTYEFMNGARKGEDTFTYAIEPNTDTLKMAFSWDTPWHIAFDKAIPQQQ